MIALKNALDIFLRRLVGAAMLDAATYEEVEADRNALPQAVSVIVLSSMAAGVAAKSMSGGRETVTFMASATAIALLVWATWALLIFQIGARLWPRPETQVDMGQLLRTLGFSAAPGLIQVFGLFPGAMFPIFALAVVWTLAASVVAVKQALDYERLAQALVVCGLAWVLSLALSLALGLLFSPALSAP
jgi:hypothetical protein